VSSSPTTLTDAIVEVYAQVGAPAWAARNLDALADVLRDLSWLGPGTVEFGLDLGALDPQDSIRLTSVLHSVVTETAQSDRPVRVRYS
jgi:hypothetical protein